VKWEPPNKPDGYQYSECRRYSVCKVDWFSVPYFEAWRTRDHRDGPHLVATRLPTSDAARCAAEEDARE